MLKYLWSGTYVTFQKNASLSLQKFAELPNYSTEVKRLDIFQRLAFAKAELERVESPDYLNQLEGMIGADPLGQFIH